LHGSRGRVMRGPLCQKIRVDSNMNFELRRAVRTPHSESYVIFNEVGRVGSLDIHILKCVYGNLIIEQDLKDQELEHLIRKIDEDIIQGIEPREDFIFTVFSGKEVGFYSDIITPEQRAYEPAKAKDIEKVSQIISQAIGKGQAAKGKLNEFVAIKFFKSLGYEAQRASQELDHLKVDVIASKDNEVTYVQVKTGQISEQEIRTIVQNVSVLKQDPDTEKAVAIIAREFPIISEIARRDLYKEFGIPVLYFHSYQVLNRLPEYKQAI